MVNSAKRSMAISDLYRMRYVSDPQINSDGNEIMFVIRKAYEEKNTYYSHIWCVSTGGNTPRQLTTGSHQDHTPRWSPDGSLLAFVSDRVKPGSQVYVLPVGGGDAKQLTTLEEGAINAPAWSPDGRRIAFLYRKREAGYRQQDIDARKDSGDSDPPRVISRLGYREEGYGYTGGEWTHVHCVDVPSGRVTQITNGPHSCSAPVWSPDGSRIAFVTNRSEDAVLKPYDQEIYIVTLADGAEEKLNTPRGPKASPAWSPDGLRIAYFGHTKPEEIWSLTQRHVWCVSVDGGTATDITPDLDRPVGDEILCDSIPGDTSSFGPVWTGDCKRLIFLVSDQGSVQLYAASLESRTAVPMTEGDRHIIGVTADRAGRRLALLMGDDATPPDIYAHDMDTSVPERLTDLHRDWTDEVEIRDPEPIWHTVDDGVPVQGWLITPPDFDEQKSYPLIVEIHGGPHAAYGQAVFHEFQVLAAAGYLVFYANPRGSTGYGQAFASGIKGSWGDRDYLDIMQVLDHLIDTRPYIDTNRLGVTGGSYGGYMTSWIVCHTNRFRAAVTQRSVVNLHNMAGTCDIPLLLDPTYYATHPWADANLFLRQSPITHVANIHTPMLILHSEGDLRCPIEQGEQLFTALSLLKREVMMVRYPATANHNLSRSGPPDLRADRLERILEWMGRYLEG